MRVVLVVYDITFSNALAEFLETFLDIVIVDTFREGDIALDKIQSLYPDIVIVDLDKQGRSGINVIRRLRITSSKLAIIAIATEDTERFQEPIIEAGANTYVSKAKLAKDLVPVIRKEISRLSDQSDN